MPEIIGEDFSDDGESKLSRLAKELMNSAREAQRLADQALAILHGGKTTPSRPEGRDSDMRRWTLLDRIRRKN